MSQIKKFLAGVLLFGMLLNLGTLNVSADLSTGGVSPTEKESFSSQTKKILDYNPNTLIVKVKKDTFQKNNLSASIQSALPKGSVENIEFFDTLNTGLIHLTGATSKNLEAYIYDLQKTPSIEYAEKDYVRTISYTGVTTNDPQSIDQWYLKSVQADDAWKIYNDNTNKITVSVNDTGIDYQHPDLQSNLKNLSADCKSDTGANIVCPNHGWNFEGSGAYDANISVLLENETFDINGHGTHVAGTIAGVGNNGTGIIGVTQNAEMIAARLNTYGSQWGTFYISNTIRGLNFAIQNGAKVVNMSYGGPSYSQAEYDSLNNAKAHGLLLVVAAGNEGKDNDNSTHSYPSDYNLDNIISVAALGPNNTKASYSNWGKTSVDIAAPGGQITDFVTGSGGILATYPSQTEKISFPMVSTGEVTISGTGSDWYQYSGGGYHTQTPLKYTGSVDTSITFNNSFSLSGAKLGTLEGYVNCDFGTGYYDADFGDYLSFYVVDTDSNAEYEFGRADNYYFGSTISLPITDPSFLKDNLKLKLRFVTDDDVDIGYGCRIANFSVVSHDANIHAYKSIQGTSMATPVVAGVASMIWSYKPELTYSDIKNILFSTVDDLGFQDYLVTGGKVNAYNALREVMKRYGITKSGFFEGLLTSFEAPFITLNNQTMTLSGTTIHLTGTGENITLDNNAAIQGTGLIMIGTGAAVMSGGNAILETSPDFQLSFKDKNGNLISSGSSFSGEYLDVSYTGTIIGTGIQLHLGNVYQGDLTQNLRIPLSSDITGTLLYSVYKDGNSNTNIATGVTLMSLFSSIQNIQFSYVPSVPVGTLEFSSGAFSKYSTTPLYLTATEYPVDYELSGSLTQTYTGTLTQPEYLYVGLNAGDGLKTVQMQLKDVDGNISAAATGSIILDTIAPTATFTGTSLPGERVKTITFSLLPNDVNFDSGSIVWTNSADATTSTGMSYTLSGITSNNVIVSASFQDKAGNTGSISESGYIIDNTPPTAPINVILNDGFLINTLNQNNISFIGSGSLSDSGSKVVYHIFDTATGSIFGTGILSGESFFIHGLNLTSFQDGNIHYSVFIQDNAGNSSQTVTGSVLKDANLPTGNVSYVATGVILNTLSHKIILSASEYPVTYTLTGELVGTLTGVLTQSGEITITFTPGEGLRAFDVRYTDIVGNQGPSFGGLIFIDTSLPSITFASHSSGTTLEGGTLTLTGTINDNYGVKSLIFNNTGVTLSSGSFTLPLSLTGGLNQFAFTGTDDANNILTGTFDIIRLPKVSNIQYTIVGASTVTISFDTDIVSTGEILYGIHSGSLLNSFVSSGVALHHALTLTGLQASQSYDYQARGYVNTYTGILSSLGTFNLPSALDISSFTGSTTLTGSVVLFGTGTSATGTIFQSTGTLTLLSNSGAHNVILATSGASIIASGSWIGEINPPVNTTFSGVFSASGYTHLSPLTYAIGSNTAELAFSGSLPQVNIMVGAGYNTLTLGVFRATNQNNNYSFLTYCTVTGGICSFQTDHFSSFTIAIPSDSTPDSFSFPGISSAELNTQYPSSVITITGINTGAIVSIQGGTYSINSGAYISTNSTAFSGDVIRVNVTSSSSYATTNNVILTVGGVSTTYSVTTKSAPSTASSGGGGGGGGGSFLSKCLQTQLVCQAVPGSTTTYKWYLKAGQLCDGGDLGNICTVSDNTQVLTGTTNTGMIHTSTLLPISSYLNTLTFQNKVVGIIAKQYTQNLISIENTLDNLSYISADIASIKNNFRTIYRDMIQNFSMLDTHLIKLEKQNAIQDIVNLSLRYKELKAYTNKLPVNTSVSQYLFTDGNALPYLTYSDTGVSLLQKNFMQKFAQSQENRDLFMQINKVLYITSKLTSAHALGEDEKKVILLDLKLHNTRLDAYFKRFSKPIKVSNTETSSVETLQEPIKNDVILEQAEVIYEFPFNSIKLGSDEWFNKSTAILFTGDRVKLLRKVNVHGLLEVEVVKSGIKSNIGKKGYIFIKYLREVKK